MRCFTESIDFMVDDIVAASRAACAMGLPGFTPQSPLFIMGESLGGCLALLATLKHVRGCAPHCGTVAPCAMRAAACRGC